MLIRLVEFFCHMCRKQDITLYSINMHNHFSIKKLKSAYMLINSDIYKENVL
jgi:hypothetical protein